jgi:hypothetical protein
VYYENVYRLSQSFSPKADVIVINWQQSNTRMSNSMSSSVPYIVLVAKQREIEELKRLKSRSQLVDALGHMIHVLQAERGASSIFLASSGERFEATRLELISESESVERELRSIIANELGNSSFANAKMISLMAWVLLGLDALPELRQRISNQKLIGAEAVEVFSRLIAGLISLIFEVADAAVDPDISRLLVSLFNLVEGKELSGQERAVGALVFGSGQCDGSLQQRVLHLIDAQDRNFRIFQEFAEEPVTTKWHAMDGMAFVAKLQHLRQLIRAATPDRALDPGLTEAWFECCSERISYMWSIQCDLIDALQQRCLTLISKAERELLDSEGLLQSLRQKPLARAGAIDRFLDPELPVEQCLSFRSADHEGPRPAHSIIELLQAQSQHLAQMESELASAKRALNERKIIERAKGILMARYNLSEDEAYKKMRTTSMDQNRRLVEVAESVLAMASFS